MERQRTTSTTGTIGSDRSVDVVFDVLADATTLPRWAPDFVDSVTRVEHGWSATRNGREYSLQVCVSDFPGTADFHLHRRVDQSGDVERLLASAATYPPDEPHNLYLRVIERGDFGSLIAMLRPVPPGADEAAFHATLVRELEALAALVSEHVIDEARSAERTEYGAAIALTTDVHSMREVAALLGEASFGHDRDDPLNPRKPHGDKYGTTSWFLRSSCAATEPLVSHIEELTGFIETHRAAIDSLGAPGLSLMMCDVSSHDVRGRFDLSAGLLRRLADLGIQVDFSVG
jgi:hypothetical protein